MGIDQIKNRQRAVFLDRDGVLNAVITRDGKPFPPADLSELQILPGVKQALEDLKRDDWVLIVVTNQPDVARGTVDKKNVEEINAFLASMLPIDEILTCYHDDQQNCACRKPKPGLLVDAASRHGLRLNECYMVGDRWRDIHAGEAAGCKTIYIDYQYNERRPEQYDYQVKSLKEASEKILGAAT